MYELLTHPDHKPVIISINNPEYPDFLMIGYKAIYEGSKKQCEQFQEEIENLN